MVANKDKDKQKESLEKVTDYVEDRQLDADRMAKAMSQIASDVGKAQEAAAAEARALAAIKVEPQDVKFIVSELEVDATKAETTLKKHKGDVVAALRALLRDGQ